MNNVIYKFQLKIEDSQNLILPIGAKILSVGTTNQDSTAIFIWATVDSNPIGYEARKIRIIGTGQVYDTANLYFIGTVIVAGGRLVYHVFEKK